MCFVVAAHCFETSTRWRGGLLTEVPPGATVTLIHPVTAARLEPFMASQPPFFARWAQARARHDPSRPCCSTRSPSAMPIPLSMLRRLGASLTIADLHASYRMCICIFSSAAHRSQASRFKGKAGEVLLVPSPDGAIAAALLGVAHPADVFSYAALPGKLPPGAYRLEVGPLDGGEGGSVAEGQAPLVGGTTGNRFAQTILVQHLV